MIADLNNLPRMFREVNKEIFSRELPCPSFEVTHKKDPIAQFRFRNDNGNVTRPIIKVTDKYDFAEDELKSIMCHEMIHYLLAIRGTDLRCSHGKEFKSLADSIRKEHGLSVDTYSNGKKYKLRNG